jgi:iron complex outermembrane recepter protein
MLKLKPIMAGVATAFGAAGLLIAAPVFAQQAQQTTPQKIERIEVTGSSIKRVDTETVAPIQVITRDDITRSGQATIADVLRNIPANTGGSFGESFSNSFAPGAAGISLRGLGQKTTLVLINGRRTAGYGFAQNLQDTFVDLNSIPTSAVERVEILKDGASAIYGSDAIAGVVNIIMRRDYKGIEAAASVGYSESKPEFRGSLTGGFGDLGSDKFNIIGTLDFYKRDEILLSDTEFGADRDYRDQQGGRNFESLNGGGTWNSGNNRRAISGCTGTVYTADAAVAAGFIARGSATDLPGNTWCGREPNKEISALPGTQRIGLLGRGTFEFGASASAYAEVGLNRTETEQTFTRPFFQTTGLEPTAAGLRPFSYNINFAPGAAGNPFGTTAQYAGALMDVGTRDAEVTSDSLRTLAGLKYGISSWELDSAIGYSQTDVTANNLNRLSKAGVSAAFNVPSTAQPPRPTSTSSVYNLDQPSQNSAAVRDLIIADVPRKAKSSLAFIDTKGSTEVGKLPGGPIGLALGAEYRKEKLDDSPDPAAQNGDILGQGITSTNGSRNNWAVFAELNLPVVSSLEAQLALRRDNYSDYGSSTTPKAGLKFKPSESVALRANWGKGFRAPTLPEISPSVATFFTQVNDPVTGTSNVQISGVFAGNPDLKAETSITRTAGIVIEPTRDFSIGLDYYYIDWQNIVGAPSFQSQVNANGPNVIRDPLTNTIVTVLSNYRNLTSTKTKGVDLDMRLVNNTDYGKFTTATNVSYIHRFTEEDVEYVGTNGGTNTIPRIKGSLSLNWDQGAWSVTGRVNYIHSFYQTLLDATYTDPNFAPPSNIQTGIYPERVGSRTTVDLFTRYAISKSFSVSASVVNVFNKLPPYDPGFSSTYNYDFSQYDVRGRQFRVGLTYTN